MKPNNSKLAVILGAVGMLALAPGLVLADNEPDDNEISGASSLTIRPVGSKLTDTRTGSISNSDTDYYLIANGKGFRKLMIRYEFSGSGPDSTRLRVFGPDGTEELSNQVTDSNTYSASYTIKPAEKGGSYFICVEGESADGNLGYVLDVVGSPNVDKIRIVKAKCLKLKKTLRKLKKRKFRNRALERVYYNRVKRCVAQLNRLRNA